MVKIEKNPQRIISLVLKEMMHNPLFDDRAPDTARKAIFDEVYQDQNPKERKQ